ncbi:ribonuclease E activity regulator RraA [Alysiella crassa]|uniref:4-hydroxy-4-methyl-2-oxoglutarate aldolase n=1 Tax=Alysiella crassa TaxID=153491 RepID=A0A376BLF4_9NEIS|nr:ribonuclease E activity regulator RraA [Alysiella crassa]UOP07224.1 ribonuclease E activity regulator RraA [Alysiella crassa]SSY70607.1 Putative regulator of ribonuclease activity [Alysiella crassa]
MNANFLNADLMDIAPETQSCETDFKSYGQRKRFCGRIRTVKVFQDNGLVRRMSETPSDGEVMVVDGGGSRFSALMGDRLARKAMENGWAGVVIFGVIRDSVEINTLDFGVKALGTNPRKSPTEYQGEIDVPVSFGNVDFVAGKYLYSDEDGVLVSDNPITGELPPIDY